MPIMSHDVISVIEGGGVCHTGGSVMESYQFEILDKYFSVIVTIPHISIKTQSLCIPTYFSVYLKPQEVIIMQKIHKYLKTKTFLSSRWWCPWCHMIMVGTQSNFWILAHFYQDLCNSCIKSEARTEFSGLFLHIYKSFRQLSNWSPLWPTLITYVGWPDHGLDDQPFHHGGFPV